MNNLQTAPQRTRSSGMKLDIQLGTRMLLSINGTEDKHGTELVGLVPYEYLIFKMPMVPGVRTRLVPGESLTMRFLYQGTIIGFRTYIIALISKPGALVFVEYPDSLEQYELRSHKRLKCLIPAEVHCAHGVQRGAIVDLSAGGCKICLDIKRTDPFHSITAQDMLVLKANLFAGGESTLSCVCRNVETERSSLILGMSFSNMDKDEVQRLREYIDTVSTFL